MSDNKKHALLSPSGSSTWMTCPGSCVLGFKIPNQESDYATEGTQAHALAEAILTGKEAYCKDEDMLAYVTEYVDYVQGLGGKNFVEVSLPLEFLTREKDARGTADIVNINGDMLTVVDLKFGRGVPVYAEKNSQLMIYARAALEEFGFLGDFTRVKLVVHQPRIGNVSAWECSVEELIAFGEDVTASAEIAWALMKTGKATFLKSSEKGCRFCKVKAVCPLLREEAFKAAQVDFDGTEEDVLAESLGKVERVEMWCKAVKQEAHRKLINGGEVKGFKVVAGKRGARKWTDNATVESALRAMGQLSGKVYSTPALLTAAQMEKVFKKSLPDVWEKLANFISQPEGKPQIVREEDPRPAFVVDPLSGFDSVGDEEDE